MSFIFLLHSYQLRSNGIFSSSDLQVSDSEINFVGSYWIYLSMEGENVSEGIE